MPYELIREPERRGLTKRFFGFVSAPEYVQSIRAVQASVFFDELRYVINDFSGIAGHAITESTLETVAVANYGAHASNPNLRVVYVTEDAAFENLINQQLVESDMVSYQVVVKPTLDAGRDWLAKQPDLNNIRAGRWR